MSDILPEVLRISRLLSPEHRADLLAWVHLAHTAESSARKAIGPGVQNDSVSSLKLHEYSCIKNSRRRMK